MKKLLAIFLAAVIMLSLTACATPTPTLSEAAAPQITPTPTVTPKPANTPTPKPTPTIPQKIGISMPVKALSRWSDDSYLYPIRSMLRAEGYEVELQFADGDIEVQIAQIEIMIEEGCNVLVIVAIEANRLATVLEQAKEKGIPVIAYDRLILDTDAVTYYVGFDSVMVGTLQGEYIRDALNLDTADGPFNIELITGDPGDTAGYFSFRGAMDVLQPYIDSGKLVVPSGETTFSRVATSGWSSENAQFRFERIIDGYYSSDKKLDAVMASNDSTALGVTNALLTAGYTKDNFPIITGQDCDIASVKNMLAGYQSMSVFKERHTLDAKVAEMVNAIIKGTEVPVTHTTIPYQDGSIAPSYLCTPISVTVDNYEEILIDSGYYLEHQLEY